MQSGERVTVIFEEQRLGLNFTPSSWPAIESIADGSPAAAQLRVGMCLVEVQGEDVVGKSQEEVQRVFQAAGRPLQLTFQAHDLAAKARAFPTWIPSAETAVCMHCSKEFGFRRHRHHCRHCGWAVCDSCSPQKLQLNRWLENEKPHTLREGPSPSTLRVCTSCAQALVAPQPKVEPEPNLQRPPAPLPLPQPELQVRSTVCFSVCQSGAHPSATTDIGVAVWSGA